MTLSIEKAEKLFWRQESLNFCDLNYRQLWGYGVASAERVKAQCEHVAIYDKQMLISLADVRIKKIPIINTGIAYINGGPLINADREADMERLSLGLKMLVSEFVWRRKLLLRINPLPRCGLDHRACNVFYDAGFRLTKSVRPYRTMVIDIGVPSEEIRKQFHQKWRNCLNNSQKQNITVVSGSKQELFEKFSVLYKALRSRKEFQVEQDDMFFMQVQSDLDESEKLYISIAEIDGIPVAGHISSMLGDTCIYLLGASNEQALKTKAAYLLQWHVIETAKTKGCRWYDLGGIDPEINPGVYHFKQGMGGCDVVIPGQYEYYPCGLRRLFIVGCERLYRIRKRWFRKKPTHKFS